MATLDIEAAPLTPAEHQVQLRRAVIASTSAPRSNGTTSSSTAPSPASSSPSCSSRTPIRWSARCEAFAIYAVGFVARPIGAAIFGHYGDRIGRKSTLIATLLLMGLATFAVGLVPDLRQRSASGAR